MTTDILIYLVEASICLMLFYTLYRALLSRETFHGLNRAYLVATVLLSIAIPALDIPIQAGSAAWSRLKSHDGLKRVWRRAPSSAPSRDLSRGTSVAVAPSGEARPASTQQTGRVSNVRVPVAVVLMTVYLAGVALLLVRFAVGLAGIVRLLRSGRPMVIGGARVLDVRQDVGPCCFLNTILVNAQSLSHDDLETVVRHERVHIAQWHAVDNVLAELLVIGFWFNPFAWLYRDALRLTHEYLADEGTCADATARTSYPSLVLRLTIGATTSALTDCLGRGALWRRIDMLACVRSSGRAGLKMLVGIPMLLVLIVLFAIRVTPAPRMVSAAGSNGRANTMDGENDPLAPVVIDGAERVFQDILREIEQKDYVCRSYIYLRLACMRIAGWQDADYATLMPVSGYGLTFAYEAKAQSGAHFHKPAGADERIARATGFGWEWLRFDDVETYWQALKQTIDSGRPVQAPHMEEVLFVGYQEAEKKRNRRVRPLAIPVFVDPGTWWTWREFEAWFREFGGYLGRFTGRQETLPARDVAIDTMEALVTLAYDDPRRDDPDFDRVCWGLAGIEAFATDMADVTKKERQFCSGWFGCHDSNPQTTARQLTGRYLAQVADLFDDPVAGRMREAARDYQRAHEAWLKWDRHLGRYGPNNGWRSRMHRLAGAEAAREALEHERRAVEVIRETLSHVSPQTTVSAVAP